jgi:hypothetical protein
MTFLLGSPTFLVFPTTTYSWSRRPHPGSPPSPEEDCGCEEALPVDGRTGVAAWVVANTHMALVQLNCNVVTVAIVQKNPIVLCRGDLTGKGTFSPILPLTAAAQVGQRGTQDWKSNAMC